MKQRLAERDQQVSSHQGTSITNGTMSTSNQIGLNQGKHHDAPPQVVIQPEPTTSDFDSAFGNGAFSISACTRESEIEFSESYL